MNSREVELCYLSATRLLQLYRQRELSPVEVTAAVVARVQALEPLLNTFAFFDAESALESARASEARWHRGEPLGLVDGVPVSLKDLLLTRGWPTRRGSRTTSALGPWSEDSPAAARLREHGAVFLGKTTTSEFGLKGLGDNPLTGITRNPWNSTRTPGGSSAGAVAGIAAGFGPLAVATDGGGSIRAPSAFSGVVGLKPTFGRVPILPAGVIGVPPHVGPVARSVDDAALLLAVLARSDDRDPFRLPEDPALLTPSSEQDLRGIRIGYTASLGYASPTAEINSAFLGAVKTLAELGATLEPAPIELAAPTALQHTLFCARAAFTVRQLSRAERALLDPAIEAAAQQGEKLSLIDYQQAEADRVELAQQLAVWHRKFDLLVTPSTADVAPPVDAPSLGGRAPFTGLFALTRQPAISVPNGLSREGLPIGLQIIGAHFSDGLVLRAARAFESVRGWQRPQLMPQ